MIRIMAKSYSYDSFKYIADALSAALDEIKYDCVSKTCASCNKKVVCYDLQSALLFCNKKLAGIVDCVENPVENVEN